MSIRTQARIVRLAARGLDRIAVTPSGRVMPYGPWLRSRYSVADRSRAIVRHRGDERTVEIVRVVPAR